MNTLSKHMSDEEIIMSYKTAKVPKQQIKIICDLAQVKKDKLVYFLYEHNQLSAQNIGAYVRHGVLPPECMDKAEESEADRKIKQLENEKKELIDQIAQLHAENIFIKNEQPKSPVTFPDKVNEIIKEYLDMQKESYLAYKKFVEEYEEVQRFAFMGGESE